MKILESAENYLESILILDGHIFLTDAGKKIAKETYERHVFLTDLFVRCGVSEETAREDACKIEHHLSDETFECLKKHLANI